MLILYRYQRLFLFSLFYSGQSDHPLLAIYTSEVLSKPNTSPSTLLIILHFMQKHKISVVLFLKNLSIRDTPFWPSFCPFWSVPNGQCCFFPPSPKTTLLPKFLQKFSQKLFTFVTFLYKIYPVENLRESKRKKMKGAFANENINAYMGISTKNCWGNC